MISRGKNALDIIGHAEEHLIERIAENMHTFGMPHLDVCSVLFI